MCGILFVCKYDGSFSLDEKQHLPKLLNELYARGPDSGAEKYIKNANNTINENSDNTINKIEFFLGFRRLAIMDPTALGMQPFSNSAQTQFAICNGEIYNFKELIQENKFEMKSNSDCETILPLYNKFDSIASVIKQLDAEYAFIILDMEKKIIHASRDAYGVRPLFFGYNTTTKMFGFASQAKALNGLMTYIEPFNPSLRFEIKFEKMKECFSENKIAIESIFPMAHNFDLMTYDLNDPKMQDPEYIKSTLKIKFQNAIRKRLVADRPIGFLLSGGLDSSLVVSNAVEMLGPDNIICFSIGLKDSIDVKAAKIVVEHLKIKNHHCVEFTVKEGFDAIEHVIKSIETYDITTIRASVAQYLLSKYISENTNIKVIFSGEGADEIFGSYRYFRDAPTDDEFHWETIRLLRKLYTYDCLRSDRTVASCGLELRPPFLDHDFVDFVRRIPPKFKTSSKNKIEKLILRDAFKGYLPDEILYRSKEAFSDAVSSADVSWYKSVQGFIDTILSDDDYEKGRLLYEVNRPETKEAYYYKKLFDKYYGNHQNLIEEYWLPRFQKTKVVDPSATILESY